MTMVPGCLFWAYCTLATCTTSAGEWFGTTLLHLTHRPVPHGPVSSAALTPIACLLPTRAGPGRVQRREQARAVAAPEPQPGGAGAAEPAARRARGARG